LILWRLCRRPHADLSGEGGRLVSGRWHTAGRPVVYMAADAALAVLEVRVNLDLPFSLLPADYVLMRVEIEAAEERLEALPDDPRAYGDDWLKDARTPLLRVPSVVVPAARNVLLNPLHKDAARAHITGIEPFGFDPRLWR
jgi:RES domain-containing protein